MTMNDMTGRFDFQDSVAMFEEKRTDTASGMLESRHATISGWSAHMQRIVMLVNLLRALLGLLG
jgi:hypothetical protein